MERIAPKDRFNVNTDTLDVTESLLQEAAGKFGMVPANCRFSRLSGGFMNANFVVDQSGQKNVLRVYSPGTSTAEKERDLLNLVKKCPAKAPTVLSITEVGGRPVALYEFVVGVTLQDRLLEDGEVNPNLFNEIGENLGHIHKNEFEESGFIGPELKIGDEFRNFNVLEFIEQTLDELPEAKLDSETNQGLRKLIRDKWSLVLDTEPRHQLCHHDFNPKNLMVSSKGDRLHAVLDWEFCVSGNGLTDFGNFFRFDYDYPEGAKAQFVAGYRTVNDSLPENWQDVAKLLDLAAMCEFLGRSEDSQNSFRTARAVIKNTLDHFT